MQWAVGLSIVSLLSVAVCIGGTAAEFNECLGLEISQLPAIKGCNILYDACRTGVNKLNAQLAIPTENAFHPVSIVSATKSKATITSETTIAMLLQLAPIDHCEPLALEASLHKTAMNDSRRCMFDMAKVELYSILLRQDTSPTWTLDGYKHHTLPEINRAQIVAEYNSGTFFGSNLAIGIFATSHIPADAASDSSGRTFTRSPIGIFAVVASATVSIGMLFHHRRRLQNGYAPLSIMKSGQLQAKAVREKHFRDSARVARLPTAVAEEISLKQETSGRFAV